jgi:hypothetical protein
VDSTGLFLQALLWVAPFIYDTILPGIIIVGEIIIYNSEPIDTTQPITKPIRTPEDEVQADTEREAYKISVINRHRLQVINAKIY